MKLILFVSTLSLSYHATTQDWTQHCSVCSCTLVRGKKFANCLNKDLDQIPKGLSNEINQIEFSANTFEELRPKEIALANITDVEKLWFQQCHIKKIDISAFEGLGLITELDLSWNDIPELKGGLFRETLNLAVVNLSCNKLTHIENGVFFNLTFLHSIDLSLNSIQKITENTFKKLPALESIDLAYNQLKTLSFDLTDYIPKLNSLDLQGNPWICDCHLEKFKQSFIKKEILTSTLFTKCNEPPNLKDHSWSEKRTFTCPPHILDLYFEMHFEKHLTLVLVCKVSGDPAPNVSWTRLSRSINFDSKSQKYISTKEKIENIIWHNLTIIDANKSDFDTYKCLAKTRTGEDKKELLIMSNYTWLQLQHLGKYMNAMILQDPLIITANNSGIQKIKFQNCAISDISKETFAGLEQLVELDISGNDIKTLRRGAFKGASRLRIINLSHNQISEVEDGTFFNKTFLYSIILHHNNMEKISEDTFKLLPNLIHLDLAYNQLTTISFYITDYLPKLNSFDLQGNPWICDCQLDKFRKSLIQKDLLTILPSCNKPLNNLKWTDTFECPPIILKSHLEVDIIEKYVTLVCKVSGNTAPSVNWTRPSNSLNFDNANDKKYKVSTERLEDITWHKLTIVDVNYTDVGSYKCIARNPSGNDENDLELHYSTAQAIQENWKTHCSSCSCIFLNGIKMANCSQRGLDSVPKDLSSEITGIDLSFNFFEKLRHEVIVTSNILGVQKMEFQNCGISEIDVATFNGLERIVELDLSKNNIKALKSGVFRDTFHLKIINLSHNKIEELEDGIFFKNNFLQSIILRHNNIEKISDGTFKLLPALVQIDLAYNQLKTISFDLTDYLPKLNSLDLQGNPWICDCHLEKFKDSSMKNNLLTTVTECNEPLTLKGLEWTDTIEFFCPPHILKTYLDVHVSEKSVTLVCKVSGNPAPNVYWTRPSRSLTLDPSKNNKKYKETTERLEEITWYNLTIMDVSDADIDVYKCIATNPRSADSNYLVLPYTTAKAIKENWRTHCSSCSCILLNGIKTANCSQRNLYGVPKDLSREIAGIDLSSNFLGMKFANYGISEIDAATFAGLDRIVQLDLSKNNIKALKSDVFRYVLNLTIIDLSYNQIKQLDGIFFNKTFLELIILHHNNIEKISEASFKLLPNLMHIDLAYNHLKTILFNPTEYLPKLNRLDLQGNPWVCDLHLQRFQETAINKSLLKISTKCVEPPRLNGFEWSHAVFIYLQIVELNISTANDVTLTCTVKGEPEPDIEWLRNGMSLQSEFMKNNEKYSIESGKIGELKWSNCHIINVSHTDQGEYSCIAKNQAGKDEKNLTLVNLGIIPNAGVAEAIKIGIFLSAAIVGLFIGIIVTIIVIMFKRSLKTVSHVQSRTPDINVRNNLTNNDVLENEYEEPLILPPSMRLKPICNQRVHNNSSDKFSSHRRSLSQCSHTYDEIRLRSSSSTLNSLRDDLEHVNGYLILKSPQLWDSTSNFDAPDNSSAVLHSALPQKLEPNKIEKEIPPPPPPRPC